MVKFGHNNTSALQWDLQVAKRDWSRTFNGANSVHVEIVERVWLEAKRECSVLPARLGVTRHSLETSVEEAQVEGFFLGLQIINQLHHLIRQFQGPVFALASLERLAQKPLVVVEEAAILLEVVLNEFCVLAEPQR